MCAGQGGEVVLAGVGRFHEPGKRCQRRFEIAEQYFDSRPHLQSMRPSDQVGRHGSVATGQFGHCFASMTESGVQLGHAQRITGPGIDLLALAFVSRDAAAAGFRYLIEIARHPLGDGQQHVKVDKL